MTTEKPIRTFTLCDENENKYEINEFKSVAIFDQRGFTQKPQHIVNTYYATSDNKIVEYEDNRYYLEKEAGTKIELFLC